MIHLFQEHDLAEESCPVISSGVQHVLWVSAWRESTICLDKACERLTKGMFQAVDFSCTVAADEGIARVVEYGLCNV